MTLEEWKEKEGYSYEKLARLLDMNNSRLYRICKSDPCIRLIDAHKIVLFTEGEVDYCDLVVEGDC